MSLHLHATFLAWRKHSLFFWWCILCVSILIVWGALSMLSMFGLDFTDFEGLELRTNIKKSGTSCSSAWDWTQYHCFRPIASSGFLMWSKMKSLVGIMYFTFASNKFYSDPYWHVPLGETLWPGRIFQHWVLLHNHLHTFELVSVKINDSAVWFPTAALANSHKLRLKTTQICHLTILIEVKSKVSILS